MMWSDRVLSHSFMRSKEEAAVIENQSWPFTAVVALSICCYGVTRLILQYLLFPASFICRRIVGYILLQPSWTSHNPELILTAPSTLSDLKSFSLFTLGFIIVHRMSEYYVVKKQLFFPSGSGIAYSIQSKSHRNLNNNKEFLNQSSSSPSPPSPRFDNDDATAAAEEANQADHPKKGSIISPRRSSSSSSWPNYRFDILSTLMKSVRDAMGLSGAWCFRGLKESIAAGVTCADFRWILHFDVHSFALVSFLRDKSILLAATCACIFTPSQSIWQHYSTSPPDGGEAPKGPKDLEYSADSASILQASITCACLAFAISQLVIAACHTTPSCESARTNFDEYGPNYNQCRLDDLSYCDLDCCAYDDGSTTPTTPSFSPLRRRRFLKVGICSTTLSSCSKNAVLMQDINAGQLWGVTPSMIIYASLIGTTIAVVGLRRIAGVLRPLLTPRVITTPWQGLTHTLDYTEQVAFLRWSLSGDSDIVTEHLSSETSPYHHWVGMLSTALLSALCSIITAFVYRRLTISIMTPLEIATGIVIGICIPWEILLSGFIAANIFDWDFTYRAQAEVTLAQGTIAATRQAFAVPCLGSLLSLIFPISAIYFYVCP